MFIKQPVLRQRKRSSFSHHLNKQFLPQKLFPLPQSNEKLQTRIETYSSFTHSEIKQILEELIDLKSFKHLVCNALQLEYMYEPIVNILAEEYSMVREKCMIHQIVEILIEGKFYRKLPKENQLMFVGNSKSTTTNVNCLIAGILTYAAGKLNMHEIEHILKVIEFEQKLNETYPFGIVIDNQKISKILKKLQRCIKPMQFKQWIQDVRKSTSTDRLQNYQFLYLITLTNINVQQNSYNFLNTKKNKELISIKQINEMEKQEKVVQKSRRNANSLNQNQKYRIKTFSYKQSRQTIPTTVAFKDIKNRINLTENQLKQKKKCMSLGGRVRNKYSLCNQSQVNKNSRFTEISSKQNCYASKYSQSRQIVTSQRKSRFQSHQTNYTTQNEVFTCQMPPIPVVILIKGKKNILPLPKAKKLILNDEQNKISQKFNKIYNYEQNKINKLLSDVTNQM